MWFVWAVSWAGTVEVNTLAGTTVSDDGLCSLSEAVHLANNGTDDGNGCSPAYDYTPVTITFPGLSGTITMASSLLLSPSFGPLVIDGPGADLLILDFGGRPGFQTSGGGAVATLRGMTIANATTSAITAYLPDIVTVEDCAVVDNTSTGNGAGIRNTGTMTVIRTVFAGNTCTGTFGYSDGAGIWSEGDLTVIDSSFFANTATRNGGAIEVGAAGTARLVNVTISGNSAEYGGGINVINAFGDLTGPRVDLVNVTITGNHATYEGGGLALGAGNGLGQVTTRGSVVAQNTAPSGRDCTNSSGDAGTITSGGHNLLGVDETCTVVPAAGDQAGTAAAPLDPLLDAMDFAAKIPTHRPLGGPLVDAIDPVDCVDDLLQPLLSDARGYARPAGAGCDIGAHEIGCGDAVVDAGEACDEGAANSDTLADACRTTCVAASCGDGVVDSGEACDDGNDVDDDECSTTCELPATTEPTDTGTDPATTEDTATGPPCCEDDPEGCGCAGSPASGAWGLLVAAMVIRRRR